MKAFLTLSLILVLGTGCATTKRRFLTGAGIGATVGAVSGVLLSPNSESKGLNALVFGLIGSLAGGVVALLADSQEQLPPSKDSLKKRESQDGNIDLTGYVLTPNDKLPAFVKERLQPVIVEEFTESDSVGEDGTLHEPHKVYRIKRQAELFPKPRISHHSKESSQ